MKNANYYDTFIEVADDCPASVAEVPAPRNGSKTVAAIQYEMIAGNPYKYTQADVLFEVFAARHNIPKSDKAAERSKFFSKGQACLRASPLCKRYGWGIHNDSEGKIALYAVESPEYNRLASDKALKHLKGMRSKRA